MIKRISIPLSDQEFNMLQIVAQRGYRRAQDYARMIVLESLRDCEGCTLPLHGSYQSEEQQGQYDCVTT